MNFPSSPSLDSRTVVASLTAGLEFTGDGEIAVESTGEDLSGAIESSSTTGKNDISGAALSTDEGKVPPVVSEFDDTVPTTTSAVSSAVSQAELDELVSGIQWDVFDSGDLAI